MQPIADDVRIHRWHVALGHASRPPLVVATRFQGVAGKVEVVLIETPGEILRRRADLHEIVGSPGPPERDRGLAEERVDVHRLVRLARTALLLLGDEPDNGRVPFGEGSFVAQRSE